MKVTLQKYGGIAAGVNRPARVVDAAALSKGDAAELSRLVAAAQAAGTPPEPRGARDAMSYEITVENAGRSTELSQTDGAVTPAFAALRDWVEKHAAKA